MIQAQHLTKVFGQTLAVDDLSFEVKPGQVTGFLGPNGAGKSTTMRMILGLDNPTRGEARIEGKRYIEINNPLTVVGALLDANWIHVNRSAAAHLRWLAASNGLPRKRVDEVLDLVGLTSVAGKPAGKFSLGMKQRLGLAGALIGDPHVLLFDEPVNGLDPEGILWIRQFMKGLAAQGRTVFVSSHLLSEMSLTADQLIVIGRGKLIAQAPTAEFIDRATHSTVRVRSPQPDQLRAALAAAGLTVDDGPGCLTVSGGTIEQVGDVAAASGLTLHELAVQHGSLEEAFMALTGDSVEFGLHSPPDGPQPGGTPPPGPGAPAQPDPAATPSADPAMAGFPTSDRRWAR